MRFITAVIILFCSFSSFSQNISKTTPPQWVEYVPVSQGTSQGQTGNFKYLLFDKQVNLTNKVTYWNTAYQILTADGIQEMSDITFDYDPSYETLSLHELRIIRNGTSIDRLKDAKIDTYQREKGLERALYDGSITAVINLKDVRKDDIIIYSYSIAGANPILDGHHSSVNYLQFAFPVEQLRYRIIVPRDKQLHLKSFNQAKEPVITETADATEYLWNLKSVKPLLFDSNVPAWYDPLPRVAASTFSSWKEVVDWALPLFEYTNNDKRQIRELAAQWKDKPYMPMALIRMVQDEIRYLGFESGISAFKPHSPAKVAAQRYGDCKDKSLLLVALLRNEGLEAYPVLVNTTVTSDMENALPASQAFDHCIVNFIKDGETYFVDPTIANQGGDFSRLTVPSYGYGLVIKPGETQLTKITEGALSTVSVNELISVMAVGESVDMIVRTEYTGAKADYIRSYFNSASLASIQNDYTSFYRNLYPSIVSSDSIRFYDYDRYFTNKIITEEYYHIPGFWQTTDDSTQIFAEIYPLLLASQIEYPPTGDRTMPYYMGTPYKYDQKTRVVLPEVWSILPTNEEIQGEGFSYSSNINQSGSTVNFTYSYDLQKSFVLAEHTPDVLAKHDKIKANYLNYLYENTPVSSASYLWLTAFLFVVGFGLSIYFAVKIFRQYDPPPYKHAMNTSIGSWLILPAIGICITPFRLGYDVYTLYSVENIWTASLGLNMLIGGEILVNTALFTLSILVLILFFQRRSSLPRIISITYALWFLVPLLDALAVDWISGGQGGLSNIFSKELIRSFLAVVIWIPIFNISEKVKNTFCLQYGQSNVKKSRYMSERLRQPSSAEVPTTEPVESMEHPSIPTGSA